MAASVVAGITLYAVACSWIGIDFGRHWDERYNVVRTARASIAYGTILPHWYYFPSLLHDLALLTAAPELVELARGSTTRDAVVAKLDQLPFLLRLRRVTSLLSALTIVWVFLAALEWGEPLEALFAAAVTAGSWELQYHSRWVTADPLVAQFGALTLFLCLAAYRRRSPRLLRWAAVAAGLACATKYPGGALLLPVILACIWSDRPMRRIAECLACFAAVFVLITPGIIFEPRLLAGHVLYHVHGYATGARAGASFVSGPAEHLRLLGTYIAIVQLSHFVPVALFLTACATGGAVVVVRRDPRAAAMVIVFPLAFVLYFGMQRAMTVRNVLVIIPFLAVLAAAGLGAIATHHAIQLGIAAIVLLNLGWLAYAAYTIAWQTPRDYIAHAAAYLDDHPDRKFALSKEVREVLLQYDGKPRPRVAPQSSDEVVFFSREFPWSQHEANRWNYATTWFGPYEVNFNYYPTWGGRDRIVVAPPQHLKPFRR